ncbi:MAG: hypothetical protein JXR89_03610 [Deltaproteobacteria bacterium]|nr:hypothetical protein [Deltaproteobacteria bacterium]
MVVNTAERQHTWEIAGRAWEKMVEIAIPPSPENFRVWYRYYTGLSLALVKEVDRLLAAGEAFSPETNEALYRLACKGVCEAELITEIHQATGRIIAGIIEGVTTAGVSNRDYQKNLNLCDKELRSVKSVQQ